MIYTTPMPSDVDYVALNMRMADIIEVGLGTGRSHIDVLKESVKMSSQCWVACHVAVPLCIFGVVPYPAKAGFGIPWMLGTPDMVKHQRALVRDGRRYRDRMQREFHTLVNVVHAGNHTSIQWLKRLGFTLTAPIAVGPTGAPFIPFFRCSTDV